MEAHSTPLWLLQRSRLILSAGLTGTGADGEDLAAVVAAHPSWRWWAARALLTQQRLLSGRAADIHAHLERLLPQAPPPPTHTHIHTHPPNILTQCNWNAQSRFPRLDRSLMYGFPGVSCKV
jgi:hypothetical protein